MLHGLRRWLGGISYRLDPEHQKARSEESQRRLLHWTGHIMMMVIHIAVGGGGGERRMIPRSNLREPGSFHSVNGALEVQHFTQSQ